MYLSVCAVEEKVESKILNEDKNVVDDKDFKVYEKIFVVCLFELICCLLS